MNISLSKKYAMALATLQILAFHLWIFIFPYSSLLGKIERFLVNTGYIGVDIFFFVSAYSLSLRPVNNYGDFLLNRTVKLVPLFLIAYLFGHFLWFIPALMIVYVLLPLIIRPDVNMKTHSFLIAISAWAIISFILLRYIDKDQSLGIFLFRIPIIILAVYASRFDKKFPPKYKILFGGVLSAVGLLLSFKFGYLNKLGILFKDIFYLSNIPLILGLLLLIDELAQHINIGFIKSFGNISLEVYFTQIVMGSLVVRQCLNLTQSKLASNLLSFAIVIIVSAVNGK